MREKNKHPPPIGRGVYIDPIQDPELKFYIELPPEEYGVVSLTGVEIFWCKVFKLQVPVNIL